MIRIKLDDELLAVVFDQHRQIAGLAGLRQLDPPFAWTGSLSVGSLLSGSD
jgi:hypothetical protein